MSGAEALVIPRWPDRIQRRRAQGWRMPEGAVYVGRPTKWGNPIRIERQKLDGKWMFRLVGSPMDRSPEGGAAYINLSTARYFAAHNFKYDLLNNRFGDTYPSVAKIQDELGGKDLACWCPVERHRNGTYKHGHCHADVLIDLAWDAVDVVPYPPVFGWSAVTGKDGD